MEPNKLIQAVIVGIGKGLIKKYVPDEGVQEALDEVIEPAAEAVGLHWNTSDAQRIEEAAAAAVRDLTPLFGAGGRSDLSVDAVARATVTMSRAGEPLRRLSRATIRCIRRTAGSKGSANRGTTTMRPPQRQESDDIARPPTSIVYSHRNTASSASVRRLLI